LPAAVTPFDERGQLDLAAVARLLAHFRSEGCAGVVVAGTNGEGPSLSAVERREFVKAAIPLADGLPIVLGIATSSLEEATWLGKQAAEAGSAGILVMPPAYFRDAPAEGIERWFLELMSRVPLPLLAYNFPARTGIPLRPELLARLSLHERFAGVKDSCGDRENIAGFAEALPGKKLYMGDETQLIPALQAGWAGSISGAANSIARWLVAICRDWPEARESAETKAELILPCLRELRTAPQPMGHKAVLRHRGVLPNETVRLPLLTPDPHQVRTAIAAVERLYGMQS
jgi:dihydrodipicolinate synthase/N-acetylneuraminate lyase